MTARTGSKKPTWEEIIAFGEGDGVVNLSQGCPDYPGDEVARKKGAELMLSDDFRDNQYAPINGMPELRVAIASFLKRFYGVDYDPDSEVTVVTSGTEGLYAAIQILFGEGDEVIVFEPYFPWYGPHVRQADASPKFVRLGAPDFCLSRARLEEAVTERTKGILLNTPHNPTGHVLTEAELQIIADIAIANDLIVISDEVYETVAFDGHCHKRIADLEGMFDRTVTLGSASKMFSLTGWRVAWWTGAEDLIKKIIFKHKYLSYSAPTPLQLAIAHALDALTQERAKETAVMFEDNAQRLTKALESIGLDVYPAEGGYFLIADAKSTGLGGMEFCAWLARTKKIACVPLCIFYDEPDASVDSLVRFAICKVPETISAAVANLTTL